MSLQLSGSYGNITGSHKINVERKTWKADSYSFKSIYAARGA